MKPLPSEFAPIAGKISYVRHAARDEWSSSCPRCGGVPHRDGSPPDRFRMWVNARGHHKVFGWCRRCNYVWFPASDRPLSPSEIEQWRREQIAFEEEKKAAIEKTLASLRSERLWEAYHERLNEWAVSVIESWGIRRDWADYWRLGLVEDYLVNHEYHSPAISIPVWSAGGEVQNIKLRVLNARSSQDRYRQVYKTGMAFPFFAIRGLNSGDCLVVEGEKKAMVCAFHLGGKMQVVGLPGKTPSAEMLRSLDGYGKIILCLDPDAREDGAESRLVEMLGRGRVALMRVVEKIDDYIVRHRFNLKNGVSQARRYD